MSTSSDAPTAATTPPLSIEQRRAILQAEIDRAVAKGWRVLSQTDTTAQLVKPKTFSAPIALLWFLVAVVGILIYLLYYAGKRDRQLYLTVDEGGELHHTWA